MHPLTLARAEPYVWVSWIAKLLAGEASCSWSVWFRAHYQTVRLQNGLLDTGTRQMDHAALLRQTVADHEKSEFRVYTEGQNLFTLQGRVGTLSGKPDVVAVKDATGWIVDTKSGSPKASDRIQVMIYMWAMPKTHPALAHVTFQGKVVYRCGYSMIRPDEIDEVFVRRLGDLMKEICGETEPHKAPSFGECKYCPISHEDCADRVETANAYVGVTDDF